MKKITYYLVENRFNKSRRWLKKCWGYYQWEESEDQGTRFPDYESAREATVRHGGRTEKRILYLQSIEE